MNKIQTVKTLGLLSAAFVLVAACSKGWKEEKTLKVVGDWKRVSETATAAPEFADSAFTFKATATQEVTNTNNIYTNFTTNNALDANKSFKEAKLTFSFEFSNAWKTGTATPFFTSLTEFSINYNNISGASVYHQSFEVISTNDKVYLGTGLATSLTTEFTGKTQEQINTYMTTNAAKIKEIDAVSYYSFEITVSKKADKPVSKTVIKKGAATGTTALIEIAEVAFIEASVTEKKVGGLRSLAITKIAKPITNTDTDPDTVIYNGQLKGKDFKLEYKG